MPSSTDEAAEAQNSESARTEDVDGSEILWRRIGADWIKVVDGEEIVSSAAFRDNIDGNVSVHIARLTTREQVLHAFPYCRLGAIEAKVAQRCGFSIIRDPQPNDPSHALLRPPPGYSSKPKKSRIADARLMARSTLLLT